MADIKGFHNLSHMAIWESKTDKLVKNNLVKNRVAEMKQKNK